MVEELLNQVSVDRIREHIRVLQGVRHPVAAPEALERAADYIYDSFRSLSYNVEPHLFRFAGREYRNIIATRAGTDKPEERLLVIAHYDTVEESPGADDNASAVAALLELARVLEPVEFGGTVHFAAVNLEERQREGRLEETALWGSRALAAEAAKQDWQIAGVIVLESIAYAGPSIVQKVPAGLPIKSPELGDSIAVIGNAASSGMVDRFVKTVERYRLDLPVFPLVVPGNGEILTDTRRSDHAPFWDRGYKAIMLTDTADLRNPHYHQPTDTLDTLNLPFAAQVCRAVAGMVVDAVE
ncbi:MAG: M28 family peptidase [Dehalococcoidia bacterium]|nr:M28 family peptidase [Dehalococcoidia bacterium]